MPPPATGPGESAPGESDEGSKPFRNHHANDWARKVLAAEEPILASCVVDYNGTLAPNHATVDAAIAEVGPEAPVGPPDPQALVAFPVAKRMAIVLTPARLLVFTVGFAGGKRFLGEVPLDAVVEMRVRKTTFGEQLSVVMRSGAVIDLERRSGDPAETMVVRLAELGLD